MTKLIYKIPILIDEIVTIYHAMSNHPYKNKNYLHKNRLMIITYFS